MRRLSLDSWRSIVPRRRTMLDPVSGESVGCVYVAACTERERA